MPSSLPRIEEIDRNFQTTDASSEGLKWVDAFDSGSIALRGLAWPDSNRDERTFRRLPASKVISSPDAIPYAPGDSAGVFASFRTDSCRIHVRVRLREMTPHGKMPLSGTAGVALYFRKGTEWLSVASGIPVAGDEFYERPLLKELIPEERDFRLYLPLRHEVSELSLGVDEGAEMTPLAASGGCKPMVVYGSSTFAYEYPSTAGSDWISHAGRLLGIDTINFTVPEEAERFSETAAYAGQMDAGLFLISPGPSLPPPLLAEQLHSSIQRIREAYPGVPIVILSPPLPDCRILSAIAYDAALGCRDTMMEVYLRLRKKGDRHCHWLDGSQWMNDGSRPPAEYLASYIPALRLRGCLM